MRYHFVLWKWTQPSNVKYTYTPAHVNAMVAMIRKWSAGLDYRIICVCDNPAGIDCEVFKLWDDMRDAKNATAPYLPSCYRRLKLYSNEQQRALGIEPGDRIVSLDIDTLITGPLIDVVQHWGLFVGWEMIGTHRPKVFNGSLQMFTAGTLDDIWSTFDPATSPMEANQAMFMGSDQAWLSYKLVDRPDCYGLRHPLVASWPRQARIQGFKADTRLLFFHGMNKPWDVKTRALTPWIERYYVKEHQNAF